MYSICTFLIVDIIKRQNSTLTCGPGGPAGPTSPSFPGGPYKKKSKLKGTAKFYLEQDLVRLLPQSAPNLLLIKATTFRFFAARGCLSKTKA